ncbi:MAG: branched-chain amino acid aminotransferase [Christensenellales bacterium]
MSEIQFTPATSFKPKPENEARMGFGKLFTDYMFTMEYNPDAGWHGARIEPYHPFTLDPSCAVFHYGQEIFEGLKCYRRADGGVQIFRARDNFARMNISAERMCIPQFDESLALRALTELLRVEADWVPRTIGASLYIRPAIIAVDAMLGVHASREYIFFIILSPSGAYYPGGINPVGIYVEDEYVRAVRGGVGFAKTGGNYAASIKAGDIAEKRGYTQVLWLDGVEQKYVEEVGAMNMMFVLDGTIVTPALNGSILPGITRDSILTLARDMGYPVEERAVAIREVIDAAQSGRLSEAFGTGTAAVISPVGKLGFGETDYVIGGGKIGPVAQRMYDTLTGIQYGAIADQYGWVTRID